MHYPLTASARPAAPARLLDVAGRINAERLVVLGWSRAILLQFAHPLVAAGVHEHSGFRTSPLAAVTRLRHTIRAMLAISFGSDKERTRTIDTIRGIHTRVNGHLRERVGPFPAGTRYSAEDPALVLWVHLTLIESIVIVYEMLVRPLSRQERDEYCAVSAPVAVELGAPDAAVPRTWDALRSAIDAISRSGVIAVGTDARELGHAVVWPAGAWLAGPAAWCNKVLTTGLLPENLRADYGFRWGRLHAGVFAVTVRMVRTMRRCLPDRVALWRDARF